MKIVNLPVMLGALLVYLGSVTVAPVLAAEFCADEYSIDVTLPNQARWDMCWEHRQREGIVLHKVFYTPRDGTRRMVLNKASLAQIHVPYDDNGARYHDISDYGLGGNFMFTLKDTDCPEGELLPFNGKNVICKRLEQHVGGFRASEDSQTGDAFSVFSISGIGSYNYIPLWRFFDDGRIEPAMGATGALQRFGDGRGVAQGWLIADNKVGLGHAHNFFWRLDFDLAGTSKNDSVEEMNFTPQDDGSIKRSTQRFTTEKARSVKPETLRYWRIVDGQVVNGKGMAVSYDIHLPESGQRETGPEFEAFTYNDIYFTRNRACERYASHNPITDDCADSLASFVNDEDLEGEDIVVWPSTTFYHMPRAEDAPNMDAHWSYISLIPRDWHDSNPLSDSADIVVADSGGGTTDGGTTDGGTTGGGITINRGGGGGGGMGSLLLVALSGLWAVRRLYRPRLTSVKSLPHTVLP